MSLVNYKISLLKNNLTFNDLKNIFKYELQKNFNNYTKTDEYKLDKYFNKFNTTNDIKYYKYLNKYSEMYIQNGGGLTNTVDIDTLKTKNFNIGDLTKNTIGTQIENVSVFENEDEYLQSLKEYNYKKKYRLEATDIFMNKILTAEKHESYANYIYFQLLDTIEKFNEIFNLEKKLKLLYKGGNTFRQYFFILQKNKQSQCITDIIKKTSKGDHDFTIEYTLGMGDNIDKLKIALFMTLYDIKKELTKILPDIESSNGLLFNYLLHNLRLHATTNNHTINSFTRKNKESTIIQFGDNNTDYKLDKEKIYGKENTLNSIYITYLENIYITQFKININFNLFRLRMYNSITVNDKDDINNTNNINASIELIDVSFIDGNDTSKYLFNDLFRLLNKSNINKYLTVYYGGKNIDIPSPLYMFCDLSVMLFYGNLFPWHENKFEKRIKRLFHTFIIYILFNKLKRKEEMSILNTSFEYEYCDTINKLFLKFKESIDHLKILFDSDDQLLSIYENIKIDNNYKSYCSISNNDYSGASSSGASSSGDESDDDNLSGASSSGNESDDDNLSGASSSGASSSGASSSGANIGGGPTEISGNCILNIIIYNIFDIISYKKYFKDDGSILSRFLSFFNRNSTNQFKMFDKYEEYDNFEDNDIDNLSSKYKYSSELYSLDTIKEEVNNCNANVIKYLDKISSLVDDIEFKSLISYADDFNPVDINFNIDYLF